MRHISVDYDQDIKPIRELLCERFPKLFFPRSGKTKLPLKRGIYQDLRREVPEIRGKLLSVFLKIYTSGPKYTKALAESTHRYDLQGNPVERIPGRHIVWQKERYKKQKERRRLRREEREKSYEITTSSQSNVISG